MGTSSHLRDCSNPERVRAFTVRAVTLSGPKDSHSGPSVYLMSYYRQIIERFAKIPAPLHNLTRQVVEFMWTSECQEAFDCGKK